MYIWGSTKFCTSPKCVCDNIKSLLDKCFQRSAIRLSFLKEKENILAMYWKTYIAKSRIESILTNLLCFQLGVLIL